MSREQHVRSAKAAGVVGLAVMSSRVLGLVREMVFAALYGAGNFLDAFLMAFRTPNLLRDLFAEGALSTAFVTTFSKKIATEGDGSAWRLANKIATLTAVFMSGVVLMGIIFAPWIIRFLAPYWPQEQIALTVLLARIMYPFILLVSLAALVMGMLNAKHVFGMPAMASTFFNMGSILGGVAFGYWLDPSWGPRSLVGLSLGTLLGGLLQLVVQFPSLWKVGYRFRPDFHWRDSGVAQVLRLMGPAVIASSAVQVNVLINGMFASALEEGTVSWLQIAFRLMQFPLGVFGVAIGTVTLPLISKSAAAGNLNEFCSTLARGMRLAFFLTIPSTVGLIVFSEPIISLLYERGRFTGEMAHQTAAALNFYAVGLAAYSALKVLTPAFYALDKRHTPMLIGFVSIGVNIVLNGIFTFQLGLGHRGLALSTGLVAVLNFLILYFLMHRHLGGLELRETARALAKIAAASAVMAAVCLAARYFALGHWAEWNTLIRAVVLLPMIGIAAAAFFTCCWLLRIEETTMAAEIVRKRLAKKRNTQ
jgi:putative peptidoglycan lipid II flippase